MELVRIYRGTTIYDNSQNEALAMYGFVAFQKPSEKTDALLVSGYRVVSFKDCSGFIKVRRC